jgi:hypothetical protein
MSEIVESLNSRMNEIRVVDTCAGAPGGCVPNTVLVDSSIAWHSGAGLFDRSLSDDARIVTYWKDAFASSSRVRFSDTCIGAPPACSIAAVEVPPPNVLLSTSAPLPRLSANGRFIVFSHAEEVFVHDNCIGAPAGCFVADVRVSEPSTGAPTDGNLPTIDGVGRWVAFASGDIFLALTGH